MNKIPIFFCFDKNMVMPAGVCITSMLLNKHTNTYYDFFILYNEENLSSEYRSQILKIQDFYSKDCRVSFFNVGESFKNAYEVRNITVSTYYRLLVPELIDQINSLHQTDYQTIIYLDVDTIIECDLSAVLALAQSKVDTCLLGVCESPTYCNVNTSYWEKIGCDPSSYINAGVLIMNIPALQKMNFTSQCLLHKNKKYTYQDQDIINIVCKGKIEFLPLKYNYTSLLYSLSIENEKFKNIKAKEIAECSNCIIHYTGNKPWNNFCLRAEYWWYYYKHSIFKDENFYIRNYQVMSKKILLDYSYKEVKKIFLKKFKAKYFHTPQKIKTMPNSTCKVSIIVPNYNYERYLKERINSILNQTYTDYELILLDDASTDNSAELLAKYKNHPKVSHVIINKENSGSPFKQWMKGILLAKGEWIWIAEADDSSKPNFLETCIEQIEKEENISFVYTGSNFMDQNSQILEGDFNKWNGRDKIKVATFPGKNLAEHNLYWRNTIINASAAVFSKNNALILQNEDFLEMKNCGDWLFWFRMALLGKVTEIYQNLNIYRHHQSQTKKGLATGRLWEELFPTILYMEKYLPTISKYKRKLCHASIYRQIRKTKNREIKRKLQAAYKKAFKSNPTLDYYFLKLNLHLSFIPWILTEDRDRLRKK